MSYILDPSSGSFSVFAYIKGGALDQIILSQFGSTDMYSADISDGCLMTGKGSVRSACELLSELGIIDGKWHQIGFIRDSVDRFSYVNNENVS